MDKADAVYVCELLERLLRAEHGTDPIMAKARDEFMLSHGTHGLKRLFNAEKALRVQWNIPDSRGVVDIQK